MLFHHDARSYEEAATAAAADARQKLQTLIDQGRARAAAVIEAVNTQQPEDRIVKSSAMRFAAGEHGLLACLGTNGNATIQPLHRHALQQAAGRVDLPWSYLGDLVGADAPEWARDLAAHNLNTLYTERNPDARYLCRSVHGEVRGILSDRYRRLDSRPITDAFCAAAASVGALPIEGYVTDTKVALKAIIPQVFEPVPHEVMAFGAMLENSDFGNGALSVRTFCLRLWCTNYAIADMAVREVHLGGKLGDDVAWSDKTYELDTARSASAIGDIVRGHLDAPAVGRLMDTIRAANEAKVDPATALATLRKQLHKGEAEAAVAKYNSPDVELLPPGNTAWRLSNAVSWLASQTEDKERALDLMKVAGNLLPR